MNEESLIKLRHTKCSRTRDEINIKKFSNETKTLNRFVTGSKKTILQNIESHEVIQTWRNCISNACHEIKRK